MMGHPGNQLLGMLCMLGRVPLLLCIPLIASMEDARAVQQS